MSNVHSSTATDSRCWSSGFRAQGLRFEIGTDRSRGHLNAPAEAAVAGILGLGFQL